MTNAPEPSITTPTIKINRSAGRRMFWSGIAVCLASLIIPALQYSFGSLIVPWYSPILGTIGAGLLMWSFNQRRTVFRGMTCVLLVLLAVMQWHFLVSASKLPEYAGTAHVGDKFPAFETKWSDGTPFTNQDLATGETTVLTFFRGRW
jgi:hypothetical protein